MKTSLKLLLSFLIVFAFAVNISAQSKFYIVNNYGQLMKINMATCDTIFIGTMTYVLQDIAITPDNRLYGISGPNFFEVDTSTAALTFIAQFPGLYCNALVSDNAGNLLTAHSGCLYEIDRFAATATCLGFFGNYVSAGDLTFYRDTLYLSANDNQLVKIITTPNISGQLVDTMNATSIFGINTVCLNGTETMIASGGDYNYGSLYIVNPANATLSVLCDSIIHTALWGATSSKDFGNGENCFIASVNISVENNNFKVFPNPAVNTLTVSSPSPDLSVITIYDISSKQLIRKEFFQSTSLSLENLSPGIYFVKVSDGEKVFTQKLVIE
jgi:hypothetical protein